MSAPSRLVVATFVVALWGCDSGGVGQPRTVFPTATAADVVQLDGYTVEYVPGGDPATFTYRVTGSGDVANLNYVFIEMACDEDPVSLSPSNAVARGVTNTEADTSLVGVQWNQGLGEGGSRTYAMTFAGAQEVGAVTVVIRSGSLVQSALIAGACGNLFDLGGSVFVDDGDDDGSLRESTELGIQNVRVDIYEADTGDLAASATTDLDGRFVVRLLRGDYDVDVPDAAAGAFNATLSTSYDPAGATRRSLSLTSDADGVDFGYNPDKEVILSQVDGGDYVTNGETVRIWKRWVDRAARGGCFTDTECGEEMAGYLDAIFASPGEGKDGHFGNAVPYDLAPGTDPFDAASAILGTKLNGRSTDAEVLYVELFAMQLNYFSGRGSQDPLYDETLIEYFEEVVGLDLGGASVVLAPPVVSSRLAGTLDTEIASAYNRGGGGGGQVGD